MKLLPCCLLFLSLCSPWTVSSGTFIVTQTPDIVVMEGQRIHITCCWTEEFERVRVKWLKIQTETKFVSISSETTCQGALQNQPCECSTLDFSSITGEDSGRYVCKVSVEVPAYASATGNGTYITVMARKNTDDDTDQPTAGGVSFTDAVTQSPDVSVKEGETFNITCCWRGNAEKIRLQWLKYKTGDMNETIILNNQSQEPLKSDSNYCSNLTFSNITREDSGRYICKVNLEIPFHAVHQGNGTVITVTDHEKHTDSGHNFTVIIGTAVVVPLLLITLTCFCVLRTKQAQAARVIYEVPHTDSEVAEMDKHSPTSSRGSSQWCQVPVYESFDYFERVQPKESG
ncbi:uncharacterized protein LOC121177525 isoform X2 [Toxotes jaculatrix]|uniref:uncharacterized protein LOC121177525 isoform X2 n=1 Tax=Toxotes jaculatrix TaxID=941984 RepID=UPI001B3AA1E0|nr:uncharacterized protein LOC121177525 isoform X2 [Toxotes jaculatrix]